MCPRSRVCGVAVSGYLCPGQPRLLRDPPCEKEEEACVDHKCAAPARWGVSLLALGSQGEWSVCVCVTLVIGFAE